MRLQHLLASLVGFVAIVVVAGACGGSDQADQVSLDYTESPINELLGIDIALRGGDLVELERRAEAGVVECMLGSGFEYVAIDFASQFEPESGAEDPDSRAYAETNGYGISIRPDFDAPAPRDIVNPNDEIRNQLSEPEQQAYQEALYGPAPPDDEPIPVEQRTGCVATAYADVYAARAELGVVEAFFGDFGSELAELENRFRSDPRFLELEEQWATCMANKGFPVAVREEIFVELDRRMSEVGPGLVQGEELPPEVLEQMDAVADWERAVAVADWDCTQPVQAEMRTLRYGYEALFLEESEL